MVTEDPRGRRRRIFLTYGHSAHQQLTVFPHQEMVRSLHSQSDRYAHSPGLCAINTVITLVGFEWKGCVDNTSEEDYTVLNTGSCYLWLLV